MSKRKLTDEDAARVRGLLLQRPVLQVDVIPPSPRHKTPDLLVRSDGVRVFIEVERRVDDKQLRDLLNGPDGATLRYSGARTEQRIEHAFRQLRDYPDREASDHTLVWLVAGPREVPEILSPGAARTRLYGLQQLRGYTTGGDYYCKDCYFVHESIFFRRKDLDAVIIETSRALDYCLNPFSPRFAALRDGPFSWALDGLVSVVDPLDEEAKGKAFIADCKHDRQDIEAVIAYLRRKYHLLRPTIADYVLVSLRA